MKQIKSLSDKRLIIECLVNNKLGNFLIDTGASLSLIDDDIKKKYNLSIGRDFPGTIIGAGGTMNRARYCNTFVYLDGRAITQFLIADIAGVRDSIERETGLRIIGIIGLPQMKQAAMQIDSNDNLIILE